jgi:hypothetical protein
MTLAEVTIKMREISKQMKENNKDQSRKKEKEQETKIQKEKTHNETQSWFFEKIQ